MKKKFTILIAAIAAILMMTLPEKVVGQTRDKITNYTNIVSGTSYYIGATTGNADYYLSVDGSTTTTTGISGTAVTSMGDATPFIFAGSGTTWTIQFDDEHGYYLSLHTQKENGKVRVVDNPVNFTASNQNSLLRLTKDSYSIQKNNSGTQFGSYANTMTDIWLIQVPSGYTVTYDCNGGTTGCPEDATNIASGTSITLASAPSRLFFTFAGWNDGSNTYAAGSSYTVTGNVTMTAQWTLNEGELVTLTESNLELTGSYSSGASVTIGDITYVHTDLMKSNGKIQAKASSGTIKNNTAYSGNILGVIITHDGTANSTTIWGSDNGDDWTSIESGSGSITADFSGHDFKRFKITRGSTGAAYWTKIEVIYVPSTDPSINASNVNIPCDATNGSIGYTIDNTPSPAGTFTAAIAQSPASTIDGLTIGTINSSTVAFTCNANNTTTARTATVTLTYTYGDNQTTTKDVVITQAAHPTPSITASDVNINGDATNGSIAYEINDGITGGSLSASTTSTWLTPGEVTNDAVPFTCTANQGAAREATVVLTYTYNTNQTVTKNVTVTQAKAPYTTIPAMFAGATSTSTEVDVTFGGWVVSGVSTNGKNVFVTDNEGHGFNIYDNGANMGFSVGDILTGTVTCNLKKNNGYAQLLNLNSSTSGISIGTEGTLTVADIAMANLSGVNTGALVHYENLTGSSSSGNYYLSDGTTTIQIYGSIYSFGSTIVANKTYDITGIYQQYSNTKEVLPRSAADIVLKADMSLTDFSNLTAFSYVLNQGPSAAQHIEVLCDDLGTNTLRATAPEGYEVCLTEDGDYAAYVDMTPVQGSVDVHLYVRLAAGHNVGTYNGNLSFTATTLDAVNVPLQGSVSTVATYAISLVQTTGGTIAADMSVASEGTTVKLSYSDLDDCYDFTSWTVYKTGEPGTTVTVTNNHFVMPGYPVTATGTSATNGLIGTKPNDACEFVLSGNSTDGFTIAKGSDYLGSSEASNRNLEWGSYSSYKWKFTDKKFSNDIEGGVYMQCTVSSTTYRVSDNGTSGNDVIRSYTSNTVGRGFYLFKKIEVTPYTRVYTGNNNATADITISGPTLITSNSVLNMGSHNLECDDAANLVIEDGGVLITKSEGVQATVKKNVEKAATWGAEKSGGVDGWYFIASPVNGASYNTAITTGDDNDYDLFMLDWANKKWLNKKVAANSSVFGDGFTRGTGYLYASEAGNTLSVAGEIQPLSDDDDATVILANDGWNLIGNPLTCKVTVDCAFSELVNASAVTNKEANSVINPCQGIAVYGDAGTEVTFTKAATQDAVAPSNNNSLQMTLAKTITSRGDVSTKVVDNAVVSFKESKCMPKFNMIGSNTKLFIPQDDEEYSIVFSDRQGDVPLYFKANETGTYTISFAGDEMSLNGIYLIDILAEEEIDLSVNPSYTFIGSPADRSARFKIVFRNTGDDGTSDIFAYQNGNDIIVSGEGELQIFDVMGRMVSTQRVNGVETVNVKSQGVYIFRLNEKTQKIVVR